MNLTRSMGVALQRDDRLSVRRDSIKINFIVYYQMSEKGSAIDLSEYIIRVLTESYRYRLSFLPTQTYGDLLAVLEQKMGVKAEDLQVFTESGRKLNVKSDKKLREVVYLRHGSILKVELLKTPKKTLSPERNIYIQNYNSSNSPNQKKSKCNHQDKMRCLNCLPSEEEHNTYAGNGIMTTPGKSKEQDLGRCDHGPQMKCLKCLEKPVEKVAQKVEKPPSIIVTPKKVSPEPKQLCIHSPTIKCYKCIKSPKKSKSSTLLNTQSTIPSPKAIKTPQKSPQKSPEKSKSPIKNNCLHGQSGKCLNCVAVDLSKQSLSEKKRCNHGENSKCIHCLNYVNNKIAHLSFDEYLNSKKTNCSNHSIDHECPNCQPPRNQRLTLIPNCNLHQPYPKGLCNRCIPENVTLKRQEYRHVDYVQFMNYGQVQNFINFWTQQKKMAEMRIAYIYGYYAEDPFYKNGIRAIAEALYQPEQRCTATKFEILDTPKKTENLELIISSLGLEKIGMILASPNEGQYFTEQQIRTIAEEQENLSVEHSTGYKLSNFFTVLVRPNKADAKLIEPEVFMVSDQGQALQSAGLFVPNPNNSKKMKLKTSEAEILPSVYQGGKAVNEFDIQFLLVNIASGASKSNKFAILKNNEFPTLSRGRVKKVTLRDYILNNFRKPFLVKYGDLNLLLLICELVNVETAMQVALKLSSQEVIEKSMNSLIEKKIQSLL